MMIQLQGLLSTITFLDVIDIVVVAYFRLPFVPDAEKHPCRNIG